MKRAPIYRKKSAGRVFRQITIIRKLAGNLACRAAQTAHNDRRAFLRA
jgi:hypothetical protein